MYSHHGRMRMISDLRLVNELIELFRHKEWIQGDNAAIRTGSKVLVTTPTDPKATCFCLRGGAIHILAPDAGLLATAFTLDSEPSAQIPRALGFTFNSDVVEWNDWEDRTLADVFALLIKRQEQIPIEEAAREAEAERKRIAAALKIEKATAAARVGKDKSRNGNRLWRSNGLNANKEFDDE
jgi:hypothetical protein